MRTAIFGHGYAASILGIGLERIRQGEIEFEGVPLGDTIPERVEDIEIVAAFDVDEKKIGKPLSEVVKNYWQGDVVFGSDPTIRMGYADMRSQEADVDLEEVVGRLIETYEKDEVEIFVNLITTEWAEPFEDINEVKRVIRENDVDRISPAQLYFYSVTQYERPSAFINCIPTLIANDPAMVGLAEETKTVVFGDDGASGATPLTVDILEHLRERGRKVISISQFNIGGNDDFNALQDAERNLSKEITKSSVVQDILGYDVPHFIKPTGYLEPLGDKKFVAMHIPYVSFNGAMDELIINARINDSPALAGLIVDLIRLGKMAIERENFGTVYPVNAFYMKMPGPRDARTIPKIMGFEMVRDWLNEGIDTRSWEGYEAEALYNGKA